MKYKFIKTSKGFYYLQNQTIDDFVPLNSNINKSPYDPYVQISLFEITQLFTFEQIEEKIMDYNKNIILRKVKGCEPFYLEELLKNQSLTNEFDIKAALIDLYYIVESNKNMETYEKILKEIEPAWGEN